MAKLTKEQSPYGESKFTNKSGSPTAGDHGVRRARATKGLPNASGPEFRPWNEGDYYDVLKQLGFDDSAPIDSHVAHADKTSAAGGKPLQSRPANAPFTITKE